jgi:NADH-quinone oxidoreductase subunit C
MKEGPRAGRRAVTNAVEAATTEAARVSPERHRRRLSFGEDGAKPVVGGVLGPSPDHDVSRAQMEQEHMQDPIEALAGRCEERFQGLIQSCKTYADQITVEVPAGRLLELCQRLRDEPDFAFEQLIDLCGVDYLGYGEGEWETSESVTAGGYSRGVERRSSAGRRREGPRFGVIYQLLSVSRNARLRLRTYAEGDPPRVPSVVDMWSSANWYEREAFDLFGIMFEGHPDLRRILSDYGFVGHPFRKDFPLIGEVEMRYDPDRQRVVYQPVSIEPRVTVPRVIPHDHRYDEDAPGAKRDDA